MKFQSGDIRRFFFDWYAKIFQNVTPIPKFTKIGQTFMDLRGGAVFCGLRFEALLSAVSSAVCGFGTF